MALLETKNEIRGIEERLGFVVPANLEHLSTSVTESDLKGGRKVTVAETRKVLEKTDQGIRSKRIGMINAFGSLLAM